MPEPVGPMTSFTRTPLTYASWKKGVRGPGLEDIQVFGVQVFRTEVPDVRSEDRRHPRMVVLSKPKRKDVEFAVGREHRIERGEIAQAFFDHLGAGIDELTMHGGHDLMELFHAPGRYQQPHRKLALRRLVE